MVEILDLVAEEFAPSHLEIATIFIDGGENLVHVVHVFLNEFRVDNHDIDVADRLFLL